MIPIFPIAITIVSAANAVMNGYWTHYMTTQNDRKKLFVLSLPSHTVWTSSYMYRHRHRVHVCDRQIYILWKVTDRLMDRMGFKPNLSVKRSVSIGTVLNFESEGHGLGDGDGTRKQALSLIYTYCLLYNGFIAVIWCCLHIPLKRYRLQKRWRWWYV